MTITIYTNNSISIDNKSTGLGVTQEKAGTVVYVREISKDISANPVAYKVLKMPAQRYSLAHDNPSSGVPGRTQFELDLLKVIEKLKG